MKQENGALLDVVTASATGNGGLIKTLNNANSSELNESYSEDVRIYLDIITFTGTTATVDITIVAVINGVDIPILTFAQRTPGAFKDSQIVSMCPDSIKAVYTLAGTGLVFTAKIDFMRLKRPSQNT